MYLNKRQIHALQEALDAMTNIGWLDENQDKDCDIILDMINSSRNEYVKRKNKRKKNKCILRNK